MIFRTPAWLNCRRTFSNRWLTSLKKLKSDRHFMWSMGIHFLFALSILGMEIWVNARRFCKISRWNNNGCLGIHYVYFNSLLYSENIFLGIKAALYTRSLPVPELDSKRVARLKLMPDQNDQGVFNREMSDLSKAMELPISRGTSYTRKLIWGSIFYRKQRREVIKEPYWLMGQPKFYLSAPRRTSWV